MEFYVAVKYNLSHYAFISKQFDNEEIRKHYWDQDIINEYPFINYLKTDDEINDNWIYRYDDEELSIRINHFAFIASTTYRIDSLMLAHRIICIQTNNINSIFLKIQRI